MMFGNYIAIDNQNVSGSVPLKLLILFFNCVFITSILDLNPNLFVDSTLQTFPPSGTQGKISGASGPPRDADDTFSKPVSSSSEAQQSSGWFKVFTVAAYQPYFDVDTSYVLERIKDSLLPFGGIFNEKTGSNPDL
ncbi:uncharacterized protein LOC128127372 [Lactuca sativa]|uniref:Uncharacterized protein n=1 Tax=Lactuca sativa TaxID=4236 RepID=A0A9R1V219_LACSA|nr:uncharacterized protein LOC128127372 [Lactuca sativa]KAJ0198290.1 hypothetical protein LSAT_V11C700378910 [Lactuca sativa]